MWYFFLFLILFKYLLTFWIYITKYYTFMALVVGRHEGLFTRWSHISRGRSRISPYNKGHTLFIIPKLHILQQNIFWTNLTFYSICVVVYVDDCHGGTRQWDTWYLFPRSTRSRDTWVSPSRNMTSSGKQTFISPYNKGHKCIISPAWLTNQITGLARYFTPVEYNKIYLVEQQC